MFPLLGLAGLLFGATMLASLAWHAISSWIEQRRTPQSDHASVIKQRLSSGRYRVVAGVFSKTGRKQAEQAWESDNLDDETNAAFGRGNSIRIEL
jgi:hypothetical protein